jgi:uncharacterized protein YndB with AHSA1/START domain
MTTDRVTVSTLVPTSPAEAFDIFTSEVDVWWRRTARYRSAPSESVVRFDGHRLVEVSAAGATELGRVLEWEPGRRVTLEWRSPRLLPADRTVVEVRFEPASAGTRVTLEHRGWPDLQPGDAAYSVVGLWWADLLAGYTYRSARSRSDQR